MPLVRISLLKGHNEARKLALCQGVYEALREAFNVPADDKFIVVHEHEKADFVYARSYLGVEHDDGLVIVQITANEGRSVELKKALYKSIADRFEAAGVERRNVFVNLVEVKKENWSFGDGVAQYA
ncbi:tautomerase family protein [Chelatococcus sambhunathii]|uniref:Tautomerase family protein n=1 Tax=Chelatococcus sambhunathii TaxID=363953 RepID=A0ABU1DEH8_9HYPH|nr:tautomerase family protein [Chelatococcus sambhunathii]MDR4306482.1 tautomerase family protein [Chelatococcus sambhunathii]